MAIALSEAFIQQYRKFSSPEKKKIFFILRSAAQHGHKGLCDYKIAASQLPVRNKQTDDVPKNHPDFRKAINKARDCNLWHIHAGFYDTPTGAYPLDGYKVSNTRKDLVSQWVAHYAVEQCGLNEELVYFADLTSHPMDVMTIKFTPLTLGSNIKRPSPIRGLQELIDLFSKPPSKPR